MKTYLECIPCFFQQALFAARQVLNDERRIKDVLDQLGVVLSRIPMESPPPETARVVYGIIREATGVADPFRALKDESIDKALGLYPRLKRVVDEAPNPLEMAVRCAIAGNVIDFGANPTFQLERDVNEMVLMEPAINDFQLFSEMAEAARSVLYLADNAGETVFDRILIETLGKPVLYAVRGEPIINDATVEDARASGLLEVAQVLSSGCDAPGFVLDRCNQAFRHAFETADLIVSKGQGNWESLSDTNRPVFFLLKAKCSVVAADLGVEKGDTVITYRPSRSGRQRFGT